jgi:hypothetical protein
VWERGPADSGDSDHIDVEDSEPFRVVVLSDVSYRADARVVHQHIDPAEFCCDRVDGCGNLVSPGDITDLGKHASVGRDLSIQNSDPRALPE